jgi:hypothetical protein
VKPNRIHLIFWGALAVTLPASAVADTSGTDFFEAKIRPLLIDNCYECHSAEHQIKGGLRLDFKAGWEKGGDSGPAIVPGQPDASRLIKAVRYADKDLRMPPKDKRLAAEQIALLEEWVRMGAPDPRLETTTAGLGARDPAREHWAFQPVQNPPAPKVKNRRWVQNKIDTLVLSQLERHNLSPSPRADARTLIRRVFHDVTGLPPTPEEVVKFEQDPSPAAYARLVDDLLNRPQYGERWARHWLDIARYADTKGYVFEEERKYAFAYTYRDYVVQAFNDDKPFDQFVIEQLAADHLELGEDKRPLAAMGFLTLGRRFLNNQHDIIDDRIDVVTRGFMGLTVACSRCHDHKFDPVPTADYYSLYGVFASSHEPAEKPLLGIKPPQHDAYLEEHNKRVKERDDFIADTNEAIRRKLRESVGTYLLAAHDGALLPDDDKRESLAKSRNLNHGVMNRWAKAVDGWAQESNAVFHAWNYLREGAANGEANIVERYNALVLARNTAPENMPIHPLVWQALTNAAPTTLGELAKVYDQLFAGIEGQWQALLKEAGADSKPAALTDKPAEELRQVLYADNSPATVEDGQLRRMYDVPQGQKSRALQRKVEELDATHPGAPPRAMALLDNASPTEPRIFRRGQPGQPGDPVPRQFLEILEGADRKPFTKGSGRLELAQAIASTNNPLTARVLANRVWAQYFVTPLVDTPSDFGVRSEPPSNPGLLDHLAAHLMSEGWSLKALHRHILHSAAYQQASVDNLRNRELDPGNRHYWRQNRKRLDFEAMRDSLLAVAGNLDPSIGGQAVEIDGKDFAPRRSIYGFIDRQNLPGMFRTFDLASPDTTSSGRFTTTVPQQALFLMNSPFIARQSRELAERVQADETQFNAGTVRQLYGHIAQREPTQEELKLARAFLEQELQRPTAESEPPAWQYGFGEVDEASGRLKSFTALAHFKDNQWQASDKVPDPDHGWVLLTRDGGHPGNDLAHAAIRRWTAPAAGVVTVRGKLKHTAEPGDGVRARVVSSRTGTVGDWTAHQSEAETVVKELAVEAGDTVDLVVDCRTGPNSDSFEWRATIRYERDLTESSAAPRDEWNTARQFSGPVEQLKPLSPWERYAQVLLVSNEVFFVD